MNYDALTASDAKALLETVVEKRATQVADYLEGRWLGPEGSENSLAYWTGPLPDDKDRNAEDIRKSLRKSVHADNIFAEVIRRAADSVEGAEDWRLVKGAGEPGKTRDETEEAVVEWADRIKLESVEGAARMSLVAHGRTVARPMIRPRAINEDGTLKEYPTLEQALEQIVWQAPGFPRKLDMVRLSNAGIYLDPETLEPLSILSYSLTRREAGGLSTRVSAAEVSWVDEQGLTQVRVLEEVGGQVQGGAGVAYDLGGRLMLVEAELPYRLGTESMLGCVSSYVVTSTMLDRNTYYAAWAQQWFVGVQPPGAWRNPDGTLTQEPTDDRSQFEAAELNVNPAVAVFYQPASFTTVTTQPAPNGAGVIESEELRPSPTQVGRHEPVSPEAIKASLEHWQMAIYREARQAFMGMADDATASGRSREFAAGDYAKSGKQLNQAVQGFMRDILETTLHLAALLCPSRAAELRSYRAVVNSQVRAFQPTPEERQINLSEYQAGLVGYETAALATGRVDDPDAERKAVEQEAQAKAEAALKAAQATAAAPNEQPQAEGGE